MKPNFLSKSDEVFKFGMTSYFKCNLDLKFGKEWKPSRTLQLLRLTGNLQSWILQILEFRFFLWIKFSFSFQCGIFILLIFLIANQWRKPTTNGGNQWPMERTKNQLRKPMTEENIWNAAMSPIPNPGVTYFRFCQLNQMCKTHPGDTSGVQQEEVAAFFLGNSTGGNNGKAGNLLQKIIAKPLLALCACHPIVQLHYSVTKSPQQ